VDKYSKEIIDHKGLCWVSDVDKVIYLGIPKTASTSIRETFGIKPYHTNISKLPKDKSDYKVFTIIREPVTRIAAGITEALIRHETVQELKELKKIKDPIDMVRTFLGKGFIDVHTAPQVAFLSDKDGNDFKIDRVLLFDNLEQEFNNMCKDYNINRKLLHLNKKMGIFEEKKHLMVKILQTVPDINKKVGEMYKEDIELYNRMLHEETT